MKTKYLLYRTLLFLLSITKISAQLKHTDASVFSLLAKNTGCIVAFYKWIPDSLKNVSYKPLWDLGLKLGLALCFRSHSPTKAVKWEIQCNDVMNHIIPTSIKESYLYCLQYGKWLFINSVYLSNKTIHIN